MNELRTRAHKLFSKNLHEGRKIQHTLATEQALAYAELLCIRA